MVRDFEICIFISFILCCVPFPLWHCNQQGLGTLREGLLLKEALCVCVWGGVLISDQVTSPPQSLQKPRGQSLAPVGLLQEIRT